jgi:hypothetical protein
MAATLLPCSNEGLMGLREKHAVNRIPLVLFFYEDPLLIILKSRDPRKIYGGSSLCYPTAPQMRDVIPNQ